MKGNRIYSKKKTFNRVSFRKSSIGLIAVLVGSTIFMLSGQSVKADEIQSPTNTHYTSSQIESTSSPIDGSSDNTTIQQSNIAVDVKGNKPENMSGRDIIQVNVAIQGLSDNDKNIKIGFSNVGNIDSKFLIAANKLPQVNEMSTNSEFTKLDDNWAIGYSNPGEILARWINTNKIPSSFNISIPLEGNQTVIQNDTDGKESSVNLYIDGQQFGDQPIFTTHLTPYKDEIQSAEIVKGFSMGEKSPSDELRYHNISPEEADFYNSIQQWGIYFNYAHAAGTSPNVPATLFPIMTMLDIKSNPNNNILYPLQDADFEVSLNGNQVFLADSIRVFQVPDNMVVKNGTRIGINDIDPVQKIKYYDEICTDKNRNKNFESFLQHHLTDNGFHVNEKGQGDFFITDAQGNKNTNVAKQAFFIQVDGGIKTDDITPTTTLPSITYATVDGNGDTHSETANVLGEITGFGTGIKPDQPTPPPYIPSTPGQPTPSTPSTPSIIPDGTPSTPLTLNKPRKPGSVPGDKLYKKHNAHKKNNQEFILVSRIPQNKIKIASHAYKDSLPVTNEKNNNLIVIGMVASLLSLFSFIALKKQKN